MSTRMRSMLLALAVAAIPAAGRAQVDATIGSLQQLPFDTVTPNPTGIKMFYYVPTSGQAPMPVVVGLHSCQGNQDQLMSWLKATADAHGFMLAIPFANRRDANVSGVTGCWDVGSDDALARPSSSDSAGVVALVNYVGTTLRCGGEPCGDLAQVFATGQSSGAMMTNVLLGTYPELFKAGASFMGVPFGCWAAGVGGAHPAPGTADTLGDPAGWSGSCANGSVTHTPAEWAALLPYTDADTPPRMLIFHGANDTLVHYTNFGEQLDQWTAIHELPLAPEATDHPGAPAGHVWTRTRYGGTGPQPLVEAVSIAGTDHFSSMSAGVAPAIARFFGIGDAEPPAAPTGLAAGSVTATGATLGWTAPAGGGVANYVVSRVDGATATAVAWPTTASQALTGLTAETEYTYRVAAVDAAGNISEAASVEFTTAAGSKPSGGGCGQGAPAGAAVAIVLAALTLARRRRGRA